MDAIVGLGPILPPMGSALREAAREAGRTGPEAAPPARERPQAPRPVEPARPALGERALRNLIESAGSGAPPEASAAADPSDASGAAAGPSDAAAGPSDASAAADPSDASDAPAAGGVPRPAADGEAPAADGLTEAERAQVAELAARDREVRAHEQAHALAGGSHAGSPSYSYQVGADGRRYAVGGEVPIDVAPVPGDPEATIAKMQVVREAALAPAEPSSADRRIAAQATAQALEARAELSSDGSAEAPRPEAAAPDAAGRTPLLERLEAAFAALARPAAGDRLVDRIV